MNEQEKYAAMWRQDAYRAIAPGEHHVDQFLRLAQPDSHHTIIDFGCGTGRGAERIALLTNATVTALDFADNCLDENVKSLLGDRFRFRQHDLTQPVDDSADFGFCTDVMEHLPTDCVEAVLKNITTAARRVYFAISLIDDKMGALIGEPLHLTVKPVDWWKEQFKTIGFRIDWEASTDEVAIFWGSAYATWKEFENRTSLNIEEAKARGNIKANLGLKLKEVQPYNAQPDQEIVLLCGGPSLNDFEHDIREKRQSGIPVVTVNGTYNWCLNRGIGPAAQVIVDARGFNKRFIEPIQPDCRYLISSQCDHELVKALPKDQTYLWHIGGDMVQEVIEEFAKEDGKPHEWYPVPGGTTVTLRALPLLTLLGFRKFHIYGLDSCLKDGKHHAYSQPENDGMREIGIVVDGKPFTCHGWMVVQANEFQDMVRHLLGPAGVELCVYGDGLIAAILKTAARLSQE